MGFGIIGKLLAVGIALVVFAVIFGVSLYASDYGVHATVIEKECRPTGQSTVTVQERITRAVHTQPIDNLPCGVIQAGNFVIYNIRSERVRIFTEQGGDLLWDSATLNSGTGLFMPTRSDMGQRFSIGT